MKRILSIVIALLVFTSVATASDVIYHEQSPWFLRPHHNWMLIYKGWPVRWTILRHHGQLEVSCWGGKHTLKRPQDLYSILTVKNLRTEQVVVVDCRSPTQGLNWMHEVSVLKIRSQDTIEVWKTPTRPVP